MKGLLVKDVQILLQQRKFMMLILGISVFMAFTIEDISFLIGYITFVSSLLVLGTISYDDLDNGYTFLFTLPITRKIYVFEKYVLAVLVSCGAWILVTTMSIIISSLRNENLDLSIMILSAVMVLIVCLMIQFIMMPLQMKYGAEKSRIVMVSFAGAIVILGVVFKFLIEEDIIPVDMNEIVNSISGIDERTIMPVGVLLLIAIMLVTMLISIRVMEDKQL